MGKSKLKEGVCKLCGESAMLNFEHVPPRSTFNKNTRYVQAPFLEYITSKNPFEEKIKGKVNQGGVGYHAFCEKCNNFLGIEYVRSYKDWAEVGAYILAKGKFMIYEYDVFDLNLNRIFKHIISMFIAINDEWFREEYPELIEFVNNPKSNTLNDRFKVFMYLNTGPQFRYLPFTVKGNLSGADPIKCSEIAFPPYGYVLTIDGHEKIGQLANITHYKSFDSESNFNQSMSIYKLNTNFPIPLDYRSKKEVMNAINKK